ncbi:tyrosine-type recombinase/integrase [Burkholderia pseudomallei]|uniref:tyrosine-type recombinase/integrase n=1 Tax=Burkholderia pseudomallei TaxID=28450 RepID=UPI00052A5EA3|nr:integrase arm-type DNA-binding domain-containing protein [Burkholderia pseudomallei]AIV49905.1 phage integrase family protein [Burkholderia pseudomallei TSV 48]
MEKSDQKLYIDPYIINRDIRSMHSYPTKLSDAACKNAKPRERNYTLADGGGLHLLVKPNGARLWQYRAAVMGKPVLVSLGQYPDVGLSEARRKHQDARKLVAQGVHPTEHRKRHEAERKTAELQRQAGSFRAACTAWRARTDGALRPASIAQREREINKHLMPKLGDRLITDVTRFELAELLRAVSARTPEVAHNLRTYLSAIWEQAADHGIVAANIVPLKLTGRGPKVNHAALKIDRLGDFLRALDADPADLPGKIAIRLIILNAARKSEVIGGRWSEIDFDAAEWRIPPERMKGGKEHVVPLSRQAVALLRELRALSGGDVMFPNRRDPRRPMAGGSINNVMHRMGFTEEAKPHGFRALFSTYWHEAQAPHDVIELCLAHSVGSTVSRAYNRAQLLDERRELLQRWADLIDDLAKAPAQSTR